MNITVCSMENRTNESVYRLASYNHWEYCRKNGYNYYEVNDFDKYPHAKSSPHWYKFEVIRECLADQTCDWVLWIDMDAIFTNMETRVESFIQPEAEILMSKDDAGERCLWDYGWNNGVILLRNTERVRKFVDTLCSAWISELFFVMQHAKIVWFHEQSAMEWLFENVDEWNGICTQIPAKSFNSYIPERATVGNAWEPDDFILHLAGIHNDARLELLRALIGKARGDV